MFLYLIVTILSHLIKVFNESFRLLKNCNITLISELLVYFGVVRILVKLINKQS